MDEGKGGWVLAPYAPGFGRELRSCGYTDLSTAEQLRLMSHLSRWMAREGLAVLSGSRSLDTVRPGSPRATWPG